ncbi:MAG: MFS transporter [Rhodospirillales bacterium]
MSGTTSSPAPTEASLRSALTAVAALLVSTAILLMGNGLQGTLIPVRGNIEQFADFELGLLGTGYFAGFTLGCVFGPMLLRRGGHIRTYMAMASVASVLALLHAMVLEPIMWSLFRGLTGFCFAVLYVVIESWLNEKAPNEKRGAIFSIYSVVNLTVITAGQLMIGLGDPASFGLFAVASVLVSLATLPVAFTTSTAPSTPPFVLPNMVELYRMSPVGFGGCLAIGLGNGAFWTLAPVFAQDRGLDAAGVGLFMSAVVVGGALLQWPLGSLSDKTDRRFVIILTSAISAAAAIVMSLAPGVDGVWMMVGGAAFGAGALPLYALVVAHANDHAKPDEMVKVSSGLLLTFGAGAAVGPLIASFVQTLAERDTLFLYTAAVHCLLIAFVVWRIRKRGVASEGERVSFNESVITAQTYSGVETETVIAEHEHAAAKSRETQ